MSRGRFDRNPRARQQRWQSNYTILTGGLDQFSAGLQVDPGRISYGLNFEEVFGRRGYTSIKGYERFDGTTEPSTIVYEAIPFINGNTNGPTVVGTTIGNDGGGSALWVMTIIESGTLAGGDAAGYMIVYARTGTDFANGTIIRRAGLDIGTATDASQSASPDFSFHRTALAGVRNARRALITSVPGQGAILGVAVFGGSVFAARQSLGSSTNVSIYRTLQPGESTVSAGTTYTVQGNWLRVVLGLQVASRFRFREANFTGDPTRNRLFVVNGKDRLTAVPMLQEVNSTQKAEPVFGTEATSQTIFATGLGAKTFVLEQGSRDYVASQIVRIQNQNNPIHFMVGTVTAYNSGTNELTVNVTAFGGTGGGGAIDKWEISLADYSDRPFLLQPHQDHMFLGYPFGQLQTSNLGDPFNYTTTASLFGLGQELTGMSSLKGKSLAVFCERKIDIIEGSSQVDWRKGEYSLETGAEIDTIQDNDGNPIYLNHRGLTTLAATQNFGDVAASIFSRDVKDVLQAQQSNVIGSRMAFGNNQYRLYFADGSMLRMTLMSGASQALDPKSISPSVAKFTDVPTCFGQGSVDGRERMFFGSSDGFVMEEDSGSSFDGDVIEYALRMHYNHLKAPSVDKQFHKMEVELIGATPVEINYQQIFDYDDGTFAAGNGVITSPGTGESIFDVGSFDVMQFDVSDIYRAEGALDGQGRNMALLFWLESDYIEPVTLQGILLYFTSLGVRP